MEQLSRIREKLEGLTPQEIAAEILLRARRQAMRAYYRATDDREKTYISDELLKRSLGGEPVADVAQRIRQRGQPRLTRGLADLPRTVEAIKQFFPHSVSETKSEADAVLSHQISIFGYVFDFGNRIDWHRDPATGSRWPLAHYTRVPLRLKDGSDLRVVWELNRLHHLTTLGRAYALTGDERYTEEFLFQVAAWYEENPPRFGVNWTVAMEVAIRAVNLVAALDLFRHSPLLTDEAIALILKSLIAHGHFIRSNVEFSNRAASNHYLSDLIGLFVIGMVVPYFEESENWVSYSAERLIIEMNRQILRDGVDYEGATAYHRYVLEIFTTFFALSSASGIEIPGEYWERLESMFDFVRNYLKPDGTAPLIGDSDDGRLLKFKERPAIDHSYLMSIAAVLLENETFKQSSRIDEEAIWWFGDVGREAFDSLHLAEQEHTSQAFPAAQIFIQRGEVAASEARAGDRDQEPGTESSLDPDKDAGESDLDEGATAPDYLSEPSKITGPPAGKSLYAIIDCGDHGANGRGSHAHSDALSLEVFAFDRTFLRDPGTFAYTASERWRNRFRSTPYHNTVRIDGEEISEITDGQLFALGPNVKPQVNLWESTARHDVLDAEHHSYERLDPPVTHRRIITLDKVEGYWVIEDVFTGDGRHEFEFFFNFDIGLEVRFEDGHYAVARDEQSALAVAPVSGHALESQLVRRWVSLSYGTRTRSSGIIYRLYGDVPFENVMALIPYRVGDESRLRRIMGRMRNEV